MPNANITHGDDVDGLTCGALLIHLFDAVVIPANYDDLEDALINVGKDFDRLFITDLNLREALLPLLKGITAHTSVTIIDHHPMETSLANHLRGLGVEIVHSTRDCASALVYDHFRDRLEVDAARLIAYAAVSDMFDDGPIASRLMDGMDRKFVQHEALMLSAALGNDQSDAFKKRLLRELSNYAYPHRIQGVVEASVNQLEKIVRIKETIRGRARVLGRLAVMECSDDSSTGEVANIIMDALLVPVGLCWKDQGGMVNISLRGERRLPEHLGDLVSRVSNKYGGFGGGHARASGAKVPRDKLELFIEDIAMALNAP
ncbi:MAG: DHHA1 domain-containing protein [Candidatus Bathyarchaeia archaeon]|jgi:oligoribonuclease NrnB/cAMP/cGMP phosphodiesterase (DHH superfamily)